MTASRTISARPFDRAAAPVAFRPLVALRLIDVHRAYEVGAGRCRAHVRALEGVTLTARGGEILGITGAPGAGKSTLLRVAAGLQAPDRGSVHLRDARVAEAAPRPRARPPSPAILLAHDDVHVMLDRLRAAAKAEPPYLVAIDLADHELTPIARRLLRHALRAVVRTGPVVLVAGRRPCDLAGLTTRTVLLHRGRIATA